MKTEGIFIFKSIKEREGGEFTNQQGQKIQYPSSYQVKFDEILDGEAIERKVKISKDDINLISSLQKIKSYTRVNFIFDVGFNTSGCYIKLISVEPASKE